ncbi:MAG: hypothetical protein AB7D57_07340, partial [Desulfovibrionaceae bacterium]
MAKYRKKPLVVDAEQWDGTEAGFHDIALSLGLTWCATNAYQTPDGGHVYLDADGALRVEAPGSRGTATSGDWIVKGVRGEVSLYREDVFKATFQLDGLERAVLSATTDAFEALRFYADRKNWLERMVPAGSGNQMFLGGTIVPFAHADEGARARVVMTGYPLQAELAHGETLGQHVVRHLSAMGDAARAVLPSVLVD